MSQRRKFALLNRPGKPSAPGEDRPPYIPNLNTPDKLELVTDAFLKRG